MIIVPYGNKGLSDLFYLYKQLDNNNFREYEESPSLKFLAIPGDNTKTSAQSSGGFEHTLDTTRIKTNVFYDFKKGDKVYDLKDKSYWFIEGITILDDAQNKALSLRPRKWTVLDLVKEE